MKEAMGKMPLLRPKEERPPCLMVIAAMGFNVAVYYIGYRIALVFMDIFDLSELEGTFVAFAVILSIFLSILWAVASAINRIMP